MAASTRPLTLGEILDRTVQIYRRNFPLFVGISILPSALYVAISGSMSLYYTSKVPALQQTPQGSGPIFSPALLALGVALTVFFVVGLPLLTGISAFALSALNLAAISSERGEPVTIRGAFGQTFPRFWRYLGILCLQMLFAGIIPGVAVTILIFFGAIVTALASRAGGPALAILLGLCMFLLFIAGIVICFWIWIRFCLAFPASSVEEKKAWPSLQRSAQLTKGTRGRIFVMYLLVFIVTIVAYYVLTLPLDIILKLTLYKSMAGLAIITKPPIVLQIVNLVISCLERAFTLPIYAISLVLFYNDQRTRMEGYDIEQLMDHAGWSALPPAPLIFAPAPIAAEIAPPNFANPGPANPGLSSPEPSTAPEASFASPGFDSPRIGSPGIDPPTPASEGSGA
jgi:hypothetical protein